MAIIADYLGMSLSIDDLDVENLAYFRYCAVHEFHLQQCEGCSLSRYPPATACPWCMNRGSKWVPVEGEGTVHSYTEVHHAIRPAFRGRTPYLVLLVHLDTQKGKPTGHEALRVVGNLATPDGKLAPPALVRQVGIGRRVRTVFSDVAPGLSLPQWTLDDAQQQKGLALSAGVNEVLTLHVGLDGGSEPRTNPALSEVSHIHEQTFAAQTQTMMVRAWG